MCPGICMVNVSIHQLLQCWIPFFSTRHQHSSSSLSGKRISPFCGHSDQYIRVRMLLLFFEIIICDERIILELDDVRHTKTSTKTEISVASTHSSHFCACDFWSRHEVARQMDAERWWSMKCNFRFRSFHDCKWRLTTTWLAPIHNGFSFIFRAFFYSSAGPPSCYIFLTYFMNACRVPIVIRNGYGFVRACIFLFDYGLWPHNRMTMCTQHSNDFRPPIRHRSGVCILCIGRCVATMWA